MYYSYQGGRQNDQYHKLHRQSGSVVQDRGRTAVCADMSRIVKAGRHGNEYRQIESDGYRN